MVNAYYVKFRSGTSSFAFLATDGGKTYRKANAAVFTALEAVRRMDESNTAGLGVEYKATPVNGRDDVLYPTESMAPLSGGSPDATERTLAKIGDDLDRVANLYQAGHLTDRECETGIVNLQAERIARIVSLLPEATKEPAPMPIGGGSPEATEEDAPTWSELADTCPTLPEGPINRNSFDTFTDSYLETAIWSSTVEYEELQVAAEAGIDACKDALESHDDDDSFKAGHYGIPMDECFGVEDIAEDSLRAMVNDCLSFQHMYQTLLADCDNSQAGHDFWLTRNHHGAGFWDGDYPESIGQSLTDAAHAEGSCGLYIGDDGKVYSHS